MGYDDGFYYGQCKLICLAESAADNGKTVSVSNGDRSWSGTVANQKCEFLVPNRTQYAVELIDGDDTDWTGTIEAGYGECILVHLADGYEAIVEKKKLTLDEIAASVGSVADYVPDADAVKTLNTNLVDLQTEVDSDLSTIDVLLTINQSTDIGETDRDVLSMNGYKLIALAINGANTPALIVPYLFFKYKGLRGEGFTSAYLNYDASKKVQLSLTYISDTKVHLMKLSNYANTGVTVYGIK